MLKRRNIYAVILAGGCGTRFWPKSRQALPKQFINIVGDSSLFQQTIRRVQPLVDPSNILIVTGQSYRRIVQQQVKPFAIPLRNILLEPSGKNTAPAIAWAAAVMHARDKNSVMIVLPSDHLVKKPKIFIRKVKEAFALADRNFLVTMGLVPTRPDTGYGYLKTKVVRTKGDRARLVEKFTEKPDLRTAKWFIKNKAYFWNSGMFIWRSDVILSAYKAYLPKIYNLLKKGPNQTQIKNIWGKMPAISVDYGILEKTDRVAAVEARGIGWTDLGSWESLYEEVKKDSTGNNLVGNVLAVQSRNILVRPGKRLVAAVGLENVVIIDTDDALLVCAKGCSQDVKEIVSLLRMKKDKSYL